jgi:hypothetical protein
LRERSLKEFEGFNERAPFLSTTTTPRYLPVPPSHAVHLQVSLSSSLSYNPLLIFTFNLISLPPLVEHQRADWPAHEPRRIAPP